MSAACLNFRAEKHHAGQQTLLPYGTKVFLALSKDLEAALLQGSTATAPPKDSTANHNRPEQLYVRFLLPSILQKDGGKKKSDAELLGSIAVGCGVFGWGGSCAALQERCL
ncbi:hypothetical protein AOLI_G00012470 [Acnodon oligacanthus]